MCFSVLALCACSESHECLGDREFDQWQFQQTWFISETPEVENVGAAFGSESGTFYQPFEIQDFQYCAEGMTLYVSYGSVIKRNLVIEILSLDDEKLVLQFPDDKRYAYFRAGR